MAYRVEYGKKIKSVKKRKFRVIPMTVIAWICFLLLVNSWWPKGQAVLKQYLFPEKLETAAEALLWELKSGEAFWDTAGNFCREVIALAGYPAD